MNNRYLLIGISVGVFVSAIVVGIIFFMHHVSNPTSISTSNQTIPLDQSNKEINLKVGKRFLLKLDEKYAWDVTVNNQLVVNRVINIMENKSMQWVYKTNIPGTAILTAYGTPLCFQETPPCKMTSLIFRVTVIVT